MDEGLLEKLIQIEKLYKVEYFKGIRKLTKEILEKIKSTDEKALEKIIEISINLCLLNELKDFIKEKVSKEILEKLRNGYKNICWYLKYEEFLKLEKQEDDYIKSLVYAVLGSIEDKLGKENRKDILNSAVLLNKNNTLANYSLMILKEKISLKEKQKIISLGVPIEKEALNKFKGTFKMIALGGGNEVGGSSYILEINKCLVLIDAGVKLKGNRVEYPDFQSIKDLAIEVLFITHAHLDHCGGLLELLKIKPNLRIICTRETKELMKFNLIKFEDKKDKMYLISEAISKVEEIGFNEEILLKEDLKVKILRAGHILGASSLFFQTSKGNIFFTGDFCIENQKTVKGLDVKELEAHILITETTYGDKEENNNTKLNESKLKMLVEGYINKGKSILIPAFALGRSQEIISILKEKGIRLYIDGGSSEASKIYKRLLGEGLEEKVYFVTEEKRQFLIEDEIKESPSCIICSSGMLLDGSASAKYAEKMVGNENMAIILTGFQSFDTTGARLKKQMEEDKKSRFVDINGKLLRVLCDLECVHLSAHGDIDDILSLEISLKAKDVIFIHGNNSIDKENLLSKRLKELTETEIYISENNKWVTIGGF